MPPRLFTCRRLRKLLEPTYGNDYNFGYWDPKWEFVRVGKPVVGELIWIYGGPVNAEQWQTAHDWIIVKEAEGGTNSLQAGV